MSRNARPRAVAKGKSAVAKGKSDHGLSGAEEPRVTAGDVVQSVCLESQCLEICVSVLLVAVACQVAYQTSGCPRPVMEAAAALGFKYVSPAVVDACLARIRSKPGRTGPQRAGALIDAYKDEWGWSKVDCARALMHVLPQQQKNKKRTGPSDMASNAGFVWEDLPSLIEALNQPEVQAEQPQPDRPAEVEGIDPLVQAIVAIEGGHTYRSKPKPCNPSLVYTCVCRGIDNSKGLKTDTSISMLHAGGATARGVRKPRRQGTKRKVLRQWGQGLRRRSKRARCATTGREAGELGLQPADTGVGGSEVAAMVMPNPGLTAADGTGAVAEMSPPQWGRDAFGRLQCTSGRWHDFADVAGLWL